MSTDPLVIVDVIQNNMDISADMGSTQITIMDNLSQETVIVESQPIEVTTAAEPQVNVNLGAASLLDPQQVLDMLDGKLDINQMDPELAADLGLLRDLWSRAGGDILQLLTELDVDRIVRTGMSYTDEKIETVAVDIALTDGRVTAAESKITQTAHDIGLRVTDLDWLNSEEFRAQSARIDITESSINQSVIDLAAQADRTDIHQTLIAQTADSIVLEANARIALENGVVADNTSRITQTAEALVQSVTSTNSNTNRLNSAESRLTATEQVTTILSESLVDSVYSLKAIEALTASSYGVVIEETVGGIKYVSGFELLVHPIWTASSETTTIQYVVDDQVAYGGGDAVYKCILDHTATANNSPGSVDALTYWVLLPLSAKSEFNVNAEHFSVITPGGTKPVFIVDAGTGTVAINGDLIVSLIQSTDYASQDPTKSWFKLDPVTGEAIFNNMKMTFGSSSELEEFQGSIGLIDDSIYTWDGSRSIITNGHEGIASEWTFTADNDSGAMITLDTDDAFTGSLHVSLNGVILTVTVMGDRDFGGVTRDPSLLPGENDADDFMDFSAGNTTYDLGGI